MERFIFHSDSQEIFFPEYILPSVDHAASFDVMGLLVILFLLCLILAYGAVEELIYGKQELEAQKRGHRVTAIMFYAPGVRIARLWHLNGKDHQ